MELKWLFAIVTVLSLSASGYSQTPVKVKPDAFFDRIAEKNKAMGNLVIARKGNVVNTRYIGYAQINGSEKKPLNAASRFRIGSITKIFMR